jgi:hypothetical protein
MQKIINIMCLEKFRSALIKKFNVTPAEKNLYDIQLVSDFGNFLKV